MAKFRKLGVEAGLTRTIYTSSKIESYIRTPFLLLSNHWSSGNIMSFMGLYAKMALLLSFRMFTIWVGPESRWSIVIPIFLSKYKYIYFSYILHPKDIGFFSTSHPLTKNEFGHTGLGWGTSARARVQMCILVLCYCQLYGIWLHTKFQPNRFSGSRDRKGGAHVRTCSGEPNFSRSLQSAVWYLAAYKISTQSVEWFPR